MPPQQQQANGLIAKMGNEAVKVFNEQKNRPNELNFGGSPPPGIENGVARLTKAYIGAYKDGKNKGKPYFMAMATIVSPQEHQGTPIFGMQFNLGPEALCNTPDVKGEKSRKTYAQHWKWMQDHLEDLGFSFRAIQDAKTGEEVERRLLAGLAHLTTSKPFFKFRTWQGQPSKEFPNPKVNVVWGKKIDNYNMADAAAGHVEDNTSLPEPSENGHSEPFNEYENPGDGSADSPSEPEVVNLEELAATAGSGDRDAQEKLESLAMEAGYTAEEVAGAEDWSAVVGMIEAPKNGEGDQEQNEDVAAAEPAPGDTVQFKPFDKKKNQRAKKAISCTVVSVNSAKKTVKLKSLVDNKTTYDAGFDDLDQE